MKDRDLMVYLMKENIKLRKKLRETEETSDYWFQEYREPKGRACQSRGTVADSA